MSSSSRLGVLLSFCLVSLLSSFSSFSSLPSCAAFEAAIKTREPETPELFLQDDLAPYYTTRGAGDGGDGNGDVVGDKNSDGGDRNKHDGGLFSVEKREGKEISQSFQQLFTTYLERVKFNVLKTKRIGSESNSDPKDAKSNSDLERVKSNSDTKGAKSNSEPKSAKPISKGVRRYFDPVRDSPKSNHIVATPKSANQNTYLRRVKRDSTSGEGEEEEEKGGKDPQQRGGQEEDIQQDGFLISTFLRDLFRG